MSEKLRYLLIIAALVLIALFVRIIPLDSESITGEELTSLEVAKDLYGSGIKQVGHTLAHPPLYYFLLHPILNYIGDSVYYLRLLSLISGILIVLFVISWTSRLTGKSYAGILAGLLVAISYMQIYYSQQAENYGLHSLLILFAAITLYRAVEEDDIKYWILYSLSMALSFLTSYISIIYFLIFGIYVVLARNYKKLTKWTLTSLPAIISISIWSLYLWKSPANHKANFAELSWINEVELSSLPYLFANFNGLPHIYKGAIVTLLTLLILTFLHSYRLVAKKIWKSDPKAFRSYILISAIAFLPPVILFFAALPPFSMKVWLPRHLLPSHAFLMIFIAMSIRYLFWDSKRLLLTIASIFICLQILGSLEWINGPQRHPYREIAQHIVNINHNNAPVYTTYYLCPGRVPNYYLNDKDYVKMALEDIKDLPSEFILIYRPDVPDEKSYYLSIRNAGWQETESLHFGKAWGHTVVKMIRKTTENDNTIKTK